MPTRSLIGTVSVQWLGVFFFSVAWEYAEAVHGTLLIQM